MAVLLFTLQLFTNFSGSIDIIMGVSEIIGIPLPENFNLPFFSRTITEFWRRWHITLGAWLREYIFYPLQKSDFMQKINKKCKEKFGKKNGKKVSLYISMLVMWIIIGVWHGGAYTYILGSGIIQFIYIVLEENLSNLAAKINKKLGINTESKAYEAYQCIRTYLLFSFAMIFFRADSIKHAFKIIKSMFIWDKFKLKLINKIGLKYSEIYFLALFILVMCLCGAISRKEDIKEKILKTNIVLRWTIFYALVFSIIIFGYYGPGYDPVAFIYRQF